MEKLTSHKNWSPEIYVNPQYLSFYTYGIHFQLVLTKHVPGIKVILTNDKTHEIAFCMQHLWVSFYYCESFESLCVCVWPVLPQVLCNLECHRRFGWVCSLSSPPYTFQSRLSYNDPLHLIICYLISNPWKRDQISIKWMLFPQ